MSAAEVWEIRPIYWNRLREVLAANTHCGPLNPEAGCEAVEACENGVRLAVLVDTSSTVIRRARYGGNLSVVQGGLLEALCGILENKPLQEASDHAVIRLEFALRDRLAPRPVAGIVQPENADPAFALPQRLVRAAAAAFAARSGIAATVNRFMTKGPEWWLKLPETERAAKLQAMIGGHPAGGGIHVHHVEGVHRGVVSFEIELDSAGKQERLAQIETWLKEEIDNGFQLLLEAKKDQNLARTKGVIAK